ncbi:MAG: hypothetical protein V3S49_05345 [Thermodesulfobacteriota bacterium]
MNTAFCPSVVIHYKGGEVKKGYTRNFAFYKETFSFTEADSVAEAGAVEVELEALKAIFFVKDFSGNPEYRPDPTVERNGFGERVEVTFTDSETIIGYTPNYTESSNGFILYPSDPESNNEIVAVIRSATQAVKGLSHYQAFLAT